MKFKNSEESFYTRWFAEKLAEAENSDSVDGSILFLAIMAGLGSLSIENAPLNVPGASEIVINDAARFEVGCYMLATVSHWMKINTPIQQEHINNMFVSKFIAISYRALNQPPDAIKDLINSRLEFYGEMYQKQKSDRDLVEILTDYVAYAVEKEGTYPGIDVPLSLSFKRIIILARLASWITSYTEVAFEALIKHETSLEKQVSGEQSLNQKETSKPKKAPNKRSATISASDVLFYLPPQFEEAEPFMQGLAAVCVDGSFGFINLAGEYVIEPQFEEVALGFSEGLAAVKVDDLWGYINQDGKMVIDPQYDDAYQFAEGLAAVWDDNSDGLGYIDTKGQFVIEARYDAVGAFSESLARVRTFEDRNFGYIDRNGKQVIPSIFEENGDTGRFIQGFAAVKKDSKCGYIDRTGKYTIDLKFDGWTGDFAEGLAHVSLDHKTAYIDKTGNSVIKTNFDSGGLFSESLAAIAQFDYAAERRYKLWADKEYREKGILYQGPNPQDWMKWGYINRTGNTVIQIQFERARPFSSGLAAVRVKKLWGYIRSGLNPRSNLP